MIMKFKDLILHRIVFEARYLQGYRYLDRCGETMVDIESSNPDWKLNNVNVNSGQMVNVNENITLSFNIDKLDLSKNNVEDKNVTPFLTHSVALTKIISKNLGIERFSRYGLRYWLLLPVKSATEGRKILSKCKTFSVNKEIEEIFKSKIKDAGAVIVLEDKNYGHRISISMAYKDGSNLERGASKLLNTPPHKLPSNIRKKAVVAQANFRKQQNESPDVSILIDVDSYINEPQMEDLEGFISKSVQITEDNALKLIGI